MLKSYTLAATPPYWCACGTSGSAGNDHLKCGTFGGGLGSDHNALPSLVLYNNETVIKRLLVVVTNTMPWNRKEGICCWWKIVSLSDAENAKRVQKAIVHMDNMDEPLQFFASRNVQPDALSGVKQSVSHAETWGTGGSGECYKLFIWKRAMYRCDGMCSWRGWKRGSSISMMADYINGWGWPEWGCWSCVGASQLSHHRLVLNCTGVCHVSWNDVSWLQRCVKQKMMSTKRELSQVNKDCHLIWPHAITPTLMVAGKAKNVVVK